MESKNDPTDWLKLKQLEDLLGCKRTKLYELRRRKKDPLPTFQIGGREYASLSEVLKWVARQPKGIRRRKQ
jgi:predicted DNA-binding transcriptional regulator AlpA